MKKNAFTLIELLGVLLLLAVIALITFPIIDKTLTSAKEEAYDRQKDNIIEAARLYVTENGDYDTNQKQLSFQTLIDSGFLKDGDILDPRDSSKTMPGCIIYNWSNSDNQYIYEYSEECKVEEVFPTIDLIYDSSLINDNGWAKEDVAVRIIGNGNIKYCLSNSECEPNEIIEMENNTKYITTDGINYMCAISSNSLGTTEKKCIEIKLDKTKPAIEAIEDYYEFMACGKILIIDCFNITLNYNDSLSGGYVSCSTVDGEFEEAASLPTNKENLVTCSITTGAGNKASASTIIKLKPGVCP